jgi:Circularly permutated YpsA SLOG family
MIRFVMIQKIFLGGQTGADRMALDWAIGHDVPHGGWCPEGRKAADAPLEARYLLTETPSSSYPERTEWNVRDSDGTVIFSLAPALTGGSKKTAAFAIKHKKPWLHIIERGNIMQPNSLLRFISDHRIKILNVAGPRASKEPQIAAFVKKVLEEAFFPRPDPSIAVRARDSEHASRSW